MKITKTINHGNINLKCEACGTVGNVSASLAKTAREKSIEFFEKQHKKCEVKV